MPRQSGTDAAEEFEANSQQWRDAVCPGLPEAVDRPAEVESLSELLASAPLNERLAAAQRLPEFGASASEPLCFALKDRDIRVRTAAATGLAQVGDGRAIRPLADALKACFVRRSGLVNLLTGIGVFVAGTLLVIGSIVTLDPLAISTLFSGGSMVELLSARERRSDLVRAITDALVRIGERDPNPELRQALPDLRLVAVDVIQHVGRTRSGSRDAVRRIEELTERLHNLPIASVSRTGDAINLPLPSERG